MRRVAIVLPLLWLPLAAASASSTAAWKAGDTAARNACVKASGLTGAATSAPVHFSDRTAQDVVLVTGRYPQPRLKGKEGTMLCLYDRRTKRAEAQDAGAWSKPAR